jgi:folate-binding protein YgfZ
MAVKSHFTNPLVEQRDLIGGKSVVELDRGVIRVSGADRLEWLHSMLTTDFKNLKPGVSREALLLDVQGHIEQVFHALDDGEATWLIFDAAQTEKLMAWFDRMIFRSKVELHDASSEWRVFGAFADLAQGRLEWVDPWPNVVLGGVRYATSKPEPWGYREILVEAAHGDEFAASHGEAGTDALEALRIAARRPGLGEIDDRTMPHEVDWMTTAVHLSKGCYRGQEAVAKTHNLGHPPRRLVFLHLDGSGHLIPEPGAEIWVVNDDGTRSDRARGVVTSVAQHFEQGPIALALVQRAVPEQAELVIVNEEREISANQEVIVPASAGKAAGLARPNLLMGKN